MQVQRHRAVLQATRATSRSAFTLLEILVVVAIIVVVAGLGSVYLMSQMESAKDKIAKVRARQIGDAAQAFYLSNERWPGSVQELASPGPDGRTLIAQEGILDPWGKLYTLDVQGPNHQGAAPDVYTTSPSGKVIGNWGH